MSDFTTETVDMFVRFFNMQLSTRYQVSSEKNRVAVTAAASRAESVVELKDYIREYAKTHNSNNCDLVECFEEFKRDKVATPAPAPAPVAESTPATVDSAMAVLATVITETLAKTQVSQIETAIMSGVEQKVRDFIKSEYGAIERKVVTVVDGKRTELDGVVHEKFDTVCKFVANNEPVFLTGPAGSGKNVLCQQVAKALGLDFYFSNAVTQEYKITGFTDAMGVFHETQFYKAFKNGGLFMLDEIDASIPEVLIILNAAIANRYFDFPAPIGYVEAHPNFRVIAAGNTFGLGANYEYVGRNQLDMASLDRFALVKINYDSNIENACAGGDLELADFCRDFRQAAIKSGVRTVVSYRAISRMSKLLQIMDTAEVVKTCLIKSLEKDDLNAILSNMTTNSKFVTAVRKAVEESD